MKLHETTVKNLLHFLLTILVSSDCQNLLHFLLTILVSSGCTTFTTLSTYNLGFLRLYNIYYTFYLHSWFPPALQHLLHFLLTFLVSSDWTKFTTLSTYNLGFLRLYNIYYTFYLHSLFPPAVQHLLHFLLTFLVSSDCQNLLHFLLTILVSSGCTTFTTLSTYILGFLRLYKIYYTFYLHSWFPPTVNFFPHCHIFYKLLYLLRLYLRHKNNF